MNFQLFKQSNAIILLGKSFIGSRFQKSFATNIISNRLIHHSASLCQPRFPKPVENEPVSRPLVIVDSPNMEIEEEVEERMLYKPKQDDVQSWDEIEKEMFRTRKPASVEIPQIKFKGTKAILKGTKSHFDMDDIDRKSQRHVNVREVRKNDKSIKMNKKTICAPEEITDPDIGKYLKLDRDDPLLNKIMLKVHSKKEKSEDRRLLLEGRRLIIEAIQCGLTLETLIFSKIEQVKLINDELKMTKAKLIKVANHNLKLWSQVTTSPGIMGIFEHRADLNHMIEKRRSKPIPVTVVCDNIREPANLGAIIRVAAAVGVDQIIITKGCTNPWELKCIRGSSGTHFRIKIIGPIDWNKILEYIPQNFEYFIADNQYNAKGPIITYDAFNFTSTPETEQEITNDHKVLVIGGESHGVSDEAKEYLQNLIKLRPGAGAFVQIPLVKGVDSLNVASALAVVLFEMKRKLKIPA